MTSTTPPSRARSRSRSRKSDRDEAGVPPVLDSAHIPAIAPRTTTVSKRSGSTQAVLGIAVAAAGYMIWRRFKQQNKPSSGPGDKRQSSQQPAEAKKGFKFDRLFGSPPEQPKPKPPAQDVQVSHSNIPRNKQHKKHKRGGKTGAAAKRHDGTNDLPEHESTRFDDSADAWVHKKTKFENKGGKVVMHSETTTYGKGA